MLLLIVAALLLNFSAHQPQQDSSGTIRGYVIEKKHGESLMGVTIQIAGTTMYTTTDVNGRFILRNLQKSKHYTLVAKYVGHYDLTIDSVLASTDSLVFALREHGICDEVVMQAQKDLAQGHVRLQSPGFWAINVNDSLLYKEEAKIEFKYGFETSRGGCVDMCADEYNRIVIEYLNKRNGVGWWEQYEKEINALYKRR